MESRTKRLKGLPSCLGCAFGTCCAEGVELDLFEVARILERRLDLPGPWFEYLGRDRNFPLGFKFSTLRRDRKCVFQDEKRRCRVYPVRPHFCVEFPLEGGKKAPYYHELCYHAKKRK